MKSKDIVNILSKKKLSLAAAESCSGGYFSYLLTKAAGSSKVFKGGIVAYSLEAKNKLFRIPCPLLRKTKGVSEEVACLLAKKVKKLLGAQIGVSLVGFAGPQAKKGVKTGTVFLAVSDKKEEEIKKLTLSGSRNQIRKKASYILMDLIYKKLTQ